MADLEDAGLLYAPHTSAGRLPTERGLRLFVDGLLEFGALGEEERDAIAARCAASGRSLQETLGEAGQMLSGLAGAAGLVVAPTSEGTLRHIEFVALGPGRALVVLVHDDGQVENRVIEVPAGLPPSALVQASQLPECTADRPHHRGSARRHRRGDRRQPHRARRADAAGDRGGPGHLDRRADAASLIIRGQARLLENHRPVGARAARSSALFERLEQQETMLRLLDLAQRGEGVQIFIGAESGLFDSAGLSMVVAPFRNGQERIVGAIGVIGPTRINYGRMIPVVDYTARVIGRLLG